MESRAFNGDTLLKAQAIDDVEKRFHAGWSVTCSPAERRSCAVLYGLPVNLVALLSSAARPPNLAGSIQFLKEALARLNPDAGADSISQSWMLSLWDHPHFGVAARLEADDLIAAAKDVIDLVEASISRRVPQEAWRAARTALQLKIPKSGDARGYAQVVAAMSWDPLQGSTICEDVWKTWETASNAELSHAHGWTLQDQDDLFELVGESHHQSLQRLGPIPTDPDERAAYAAKVQSEALAFLTAHGMVRRWEDYNRFLEEHWRAHSLEWTDAARTTVLGAIKSAL